jgi:Cytochrome c554 and c-prime
MPQIPRHSLTVLALCAGFAAVAPVAAATTAATAGTPAPDGYTSAATCGGCHESIFRAWSGSPHAHSASGPAWLAALRGLQGPDAAAQRRACVWCHAPTTLVSGDLELQRPLSREGITCDFCHTVAEVDLQASTGSPFKLDPGGPKRGPYRYEGSTAHPTAYSSLHRASPLLCASCHEYTNARGVAVLSTYTEWKEGPYPVLGVPCQDCHMAPIPGDVAKGRPARDALRLVNQHRLLGGSAQSQLARGLDLTIETAARSGGQAQVTVVVTNVAAGHPIPGGLASKSLILAVGVENAAGEFERLQERVYRRELKDASGRVLEGVAEQFLQAVSVGSDNRIRPKESRTERFGLSVPSGAKAIVARLEYRDASDPRHPPTILPITETRRDLTAR